MIESVAILVWPMNLLLWVLFSVIKTLEEGLANPTLFAI